MRSIASVTLLLLLCAGALAQDSISPAHEAAVNRGLDFLAAQQNRATAAQMGNGETRTYTRLSGPVPVAATNAGSWLWILAAVAVALIVLLMWAYARRRRRTDRSGS